VPEGASRLTIRLASDVPSIDTDLFVRFGADVELSEGNPVSDHQASTDSGNEQIIITPASSPPLKPGTYYLSLGLFTAGAPATGTITASVERAAVAPPISSAVLLENGVTTPFSLPAITQPTLFAGDHGFRVVLPNGVQNLHIGVRTAGGEDVDLAVRFGQEVGLAEGHILADHQSVSESGTEELVITTSSTPPLRPGVYFIALPLYTTGVPVNGSIIATFSAGQLRASPGLRKSCAGPECDLPDRLLPKTGFSIAEPLESKKNSATLLKLKPGPGALKKRGSMLLVR
jgi:hypothetical protein